MKTKSLYGFSPELEPFVGKTPAEQVDVLRSWGNTAVFGGYKDPAFVDAVHRAGMRIYAEYGCFVGERWWQDVPDSRPVTDEGTLLEADGWYYGVNPSVPQVRQERLDGVIVDEALFRVVGLSEQERDQIKAYRERVANRPHWLENWRIVCVNADLKPGNLAFRSNDGRRPVVFDFGAARLAPMETVVSR